MNKVDVGSWKFGITQSVAMVAIVLLSLTLIGAGCMSAPIQHGSDGGVLAVSTQEVGAQYIDYSAEALSTVQEEERRALVFYHAQWCPTCRSADKELIRDIDKLPEGLTVLKANYDTERALRSEHGVVRQHTFVLLAEDGSVETRWVGGGVALIQQQLQGRL